MRVVSVRLTKSEEAFLRRLVREGKYQSITDVLKAGVYELMHREGVEGIPWKSCEEVRKYFVKKERKLRGLEEINSHET